MSAVNSGTDNFFGVLDSFPDCDGYFSHRFLVKFVLILCIQRHCLSERSVSHKYETERMKLKEKIKVLRQKLSECGQRELERENFTSAIRNFLRMDRLTAPLLRELIDHIDVFETEGTGKSRTQRIVIYYRFVGYVEIPEVSQRQHIKADTRKGVAVKYLTEPLPA